jgi:hypothetical protein
MKLDRVVRVLVPNTFGPAAADRVTKLKRNQRLTNGVRVLGSAPADGGILLELVVHEHAGEFAAAEARARAAVEGLVGRAAPGQPDLRATAKGFLTRRVLPDSGEPHKLKWRGPMQFALVGPSHVRAEEVRAVESMFEDWPSFRSPHVEWLESEKSLRLVVEIEHVTDQDAADLAMETYYNLVKISIKEKQETDWQTFAMDFKAGSDN